MRRKLQDKAKALNRPPELMRHSKMPPIRRGGCFTILGQERTRAQLQLLQSKLPLKYHHSKLLAIL